MEQHGWVKAADKRRGWISFLLVGFFLVAVAGLLIVPFLPLPVCPWCDPEIKHWGGRRRVWDGLSGGCTDPVGPACLPDGAA